ncbi:MAG: hypothetical protein AB7I41_20145 [Candidatus Sericytochromatia bacterium]
MKNQLIVVLTLAALNSLSGCSGNVPNSTAYPGYAAQQMTYSQNNLQSTQQLGPQPNLVTGLATNPASSQTRASNPHLAIQQNTTGSKALPAKATAVKSNANPAKGTPSALPAKVAPPQVSVAQQLVTKAVARFNALESFKFMVDGFEMVSGKTPSRLSFNMFALKGQAKIEVLKHTNSLYVGVKMGYQAGKDAISVRPGGALGFVKVDTKMNDERLSTPRGYRLDQIDAFAIAKRLLNGPQQPKVLGKTQINGRTIAILEYTNANSFDQRITRELLGIDMEDHFIRMHEMFEGDKLVFSLKLNNIQLNAPVSEAEIKI